MANPGRVTRISDRLNDFSGGLNTSTSPMLFDARQTPRCMNVISRAKTRFLAKRPGYTVIPVTGPT